MKFKLFLAMLTMFSTAIFAQENGQNDPTNDAPKILIAFFSKTNSTRAIAEQIQSRIGGDLFQVAAKNPYPEDYRKTTEIARAELDNNTRPELADALSIEEMQEYDVVFIGYPIWWGTLPMAMFTFLEQYDLSGKTVVPFCTHGGSGISRSQGDIGSLAPGADVKQGLAVRGNSAGNAQGDVNNWLRRLGYIE